MPRRPEMRESDHSQTSIRRNPRDANFQHRQQTKVGKWEFTPPPDSVVAKWEAAFDNNKTTIKSTMRVRLQAHVEVDQSGAQDVDVGILRCVVSLTQMERMWLVERNETQSIRSSLQSEIRQRLGVSAENLQFGYGKDVTVLAKASGQNGYYTYGCWSERLVRLWNDDEGTTNREMEELSDRLTRAYAPACCPSLFFLLKLTLKIWPSENVFSACAAHPDLIPLAQQLLSQ